MIRQISVATAFSLLAIGLSSTSSLAEDEAPDENTAQELDTLGEAEGHDGSAEDTTLVVNSLERSPSGETAMLWTVTNHEGENLHTTHFRVANYFEYYAASSTQGMTLLDESSQIRYYPLVDTDEVCLCAGGRTTNEFTNFISGNEVSKSYWNTYLLPDDLGTVTVEAPGYDPIESIEVTDIS